MEIYIVIVITSILVGVVCATIAKQKGRDPVKWFLSGAFLNVLALSVVIFSERKNARK